MTHQPTRRRRLLVLLTVLVLGASIQFGFSPLGADAASKKVETFQASVGRMNKQSTTTTTAPATTASTNQAPVAQITPPKTVEINSVTDLYAQTSYDPDGDAITFAWKQIGGPTVAVTGVEPGRIRFTPATPGDYGFQVTVTDTKGASSSKSTVVTAVDSSGTPTEPPTNTTVKGEASSSTVESRLLQDSNVLWVGTWDTTDWKTSHGVGSFGNSANTATGNWGNGTAGNGLRAVTPSGTQKGFNYSANFVPAGVAEQEDLHYRYRVFFPSDYMWQNGSGGGGGKLPGLAGKATGGKDTLVGAGGQRWNGSTEIDAAHLDDMDGFSARMLWQKDGGLSSYLYLPDPNHLGSRSSKSYFGWSNRCKTDPYNSGSSNMMFNKGAWNTVEQHVRLNTPGVANGVLEVWMNGKLCIKLTNLIYRSAKHPEVKITQQYVTWFYGGPTSDYPTRDSYVYFDDAVLSRSYIGPRVS
jgi:hypothetical protein